MKAMLVRNAAGEVVGTIMGDAESMASQVAPDGGTLESCEVAEARAHHPLTARERGAAPRNDWKAMRRIGFPDPGAQLEAITDFLLNGDDTKLKALKARIDKVKAAHPKTTDRP